MSCSSTTILNKHPDETRLYDFDFSAEPEIVALDTLATVTSVTATRVNGSGTLTLSSGIISGARVQFTIAGGTAGDDFTIECIAVTAASRVMVGCGKLEVRGC